MYKILLVEDEVVLRDAYAILLQAQDGLEVTVASNGQEALEYCSHEKFDLILLDLMMPILDGVGFLKKAKLSENSPLTRVVVLSNLSSGDALVEALGLGAHRHEVKSNLAPQDILALIDEELRVQP